MKKDFAIQIRLVFGSNVKSVTLFKSEPYIRLANGMQWTFNLLKSDALKKRLSTEQSELGLSSFKDMGNPERHTE